MWTERWTGPTVIADELPTVEFQTARLSSTACKDFTTGRTTIVTKIGAVKAVEQKQAELVKLAGAAALHSVAVGCPRYMYDA